MIKVSLSEMENAKSHSESFARNILGKHLNVDSKSLLIQKNRYGKPYLKNYPDIHYNISHTKGAIVCAVAKEPIGVDIEKVKNFNKRIAEYFFTQNEQQYIFANKDCQDERFAEIWTMKEAYVKWIGKGLAIPFKSFDVLQIKGISVISYGCYCISMCSSNYSGYQIELV